MTNLSERTLRRHIRNGLLKGTKIGGVWRFSEENLQDYFNDDSMVEAFKNEAGKVVKRFLKKAYSQKTDHRVCMIVDQKVLSEHMEQASKEAIMDLSSQHEDLTMKYEKTEQVMRFTLVGNYAYIEACIQVLKAIRNENTDA